MTTLFCNASALAVAAIFYTWRSYAYHCFLQRRQVLRERVAYMLWVMANKADQDRAR